MHNQWWLLLLSLLWFCEIFVDEVVAENRFVDVSRGEVPDAGHFDRAPDTKPMFGSNRARRGISFVQRSSSSINCKHPRRHCNQNCPAPQACFCRARCSTNCPLLCDDFPSAGWKPCGFEALLNQFVFLYFCQHTWSLIHFTFAILQELLAAWRKEWVNTVPWGHSHQILSFSSWLWLT